MRPLCLSTMPQRYCKCSRPVSIHNCYKILDFFKNSYGAYCSLNCATQDLMECGWDESRKFEALCSMKYAYEVCPSFLTYENRYVCDACGATAANDDPDCIDCKTKFCMRATYPAIIGYNHKDNLLDRIDVYKPSIDLKREKRYEVRKASQQKKMSRSLAVSTFFKK